MSFIEQSEKNVERLLKETSAVGGVGGFVGRAGRDVDKLYSGPYHPDSCHGSENEKLLQKQLDDRKEVRNSFENSEGNVYGGESPVGGYFGDIGETQDIELETSTTPAPGGLTGGGFNY